MVFNRFYIYIVLQIILIVLVSLAFAYTFIMDYLLITRYSLLLIIILQIILLINYINRVSRNLKRFLDSFKYEHNLPVFSSAGKYSEFKNLYSSFDNIIDQFKQVKIEKEKEYQFLSGAIQHVGIGLIAYDQSGRVLLINKALLDLLKLQHLHTIRNLGDIKNGFPELLLQLRAGQTELIAVMTGAEKLQLSLKASIMKIEENTIRLVSIQDIRSEIEQNEIDAWQKIIRVINHEIMNSLSPVNLLSSTLLRSIEKGAKAVDAAEVDQQIIQNIYTGLLAIKNRSMGLTQFVENYRNAMQLPEPKFAIVHVNDLIQNIHSLFQEELTIKKITLATSVESNDMTIRCDQKMIEQLLINLLKNSIHALVETVKPQIGIIAYLNDDLKIIEVSDNGKGMDADLMENIFIPYFSTRDGGSGIGLSLSKQIMRLHGAEISATSIPDEETIIKLVF